ncbi:ArsR/SmtB family transcription factor [Arthrobacter sp. HMWF013]|uniref:ArsR/SmtB family transcription factor n=1 Tax=Arthrobacter sp. HMWF013 TaxID=2056849 RepID=UPI0011B22E3F|nr:helix-turn-helix transcriptional regulator [Arthrobacter sp. HMWF013]
MITSIIAGLVLSLGVLIRFWVREPVLVLEHCCVSSERTEYGLPVDSDYTPQELTALHALGAALRHRKVTAAETVEDIAANLQEAMSNPEVMEPYWKKYALNVKVRRDILDFILNADGPVRRIDIPLVMSSSVFGRHMGRLIDGRLVLTDGAGKGKTYFINPQHAARISELLEEAAEAVA